MWGAEFHPMTRPPGISRRRFLAGLVLLGGGPLLSGCASSAPLRVAAHPWIGYEPLYLARDFGWLPHQAELVETAAASESLAALASGKVQAAALTLDEVLQARAAGMPLTVVLVFNVSAGADVLLVRPEIATLAELRGKRIAVERSALGGLMLAKILELAGLTPEAVTIEEIPPARQPAAWRAGRLDAAICYEPAASRIREMGAETLFDSREIPDTIFDVLALRRDADNLDKGALRGLIQGHFRALAHLRVSRQDAVYRIAARQRTTPANVRRALAGVALPDLAANRRYLSADSMLHAAATRLNAVMVAGGLLDGADNLQHLFDDAYLPAEGRYSP